MGLPPDIRPLRTRKPTVVKEVRVIRHPAQGAQPLDAFPAEPGKTQPRLVPTFWRVEELYRRAASASNATVRFLVERTLPVGSRRTYREAYNNVYVAVIDDGIEVTVKPRHPGDHLYIVDPQGTLIQTDESQAIVPLFGGQTSDTFPIVTRDNRYHPPRLQIAKVLELSVASETEPIQLNERRSR